MRQTFGISESPARRFDSEARLSKRIAHALPAFAAFFLLISLVGCGELPEDEVPSSDGERGLDGALQIDSNAACRIDSDCSAGTFCFQRHCVWECERASDCDSGEECSPRSRCVASANVATDKVRGFAQTQGDRGLTIDIGGVDVSRWPNTRIPVAAGDTEIEVELHTNGPVPNGEIMYAVRQQDEVGTLRSQRAAGATDFVLDIPSLKAGDPDFPEAEAVQLITPFGDRTLYLVPQNPRSGTYMGSFAPSTFGGSPLPLSFAIETTPRDVLSLSEAESAELLIQTSPSVLVSLPFEEQDAEWVAQPLEYDESIDAWVATFAADINSATVFGENVYPDVDRAIRVEIHSEDGETVKGAIADRWRGIFNGTSADGVKTPGISTIAGNFELSRNNRPPATSKVSSLTNELEAPALRQPPSTEACNDSILSGVVSELSENEEGTTACTTIESVNDFLQVTTSKRAACAAALTEQVLSGETIGGRLLTYIDPDQEAPGDESFRDFVERCANGAEGLCVPTDAQLCTRQLVAFTIDTAGSSLPNAGELSMAYDELTREAFIGRQLVAFYLDNATRLDWLQSSEAPPFLAPALKSYNESILSEYQEGVLSSHLESVFGQLDSSGLAVLAKAQTNPDAIATRKTLLGDLLNSWRASMDSLHVLATRWNVLYQNDTKRMEAARFIRRRSTRLYVVAAVLQSIARETGSSYMGGSFGQGFVELQQAVGALGQPFNELLFARDAEVVTSQSVDPESSSASLLGELEESARSAVEDASASVTKALEEERAAAISESYLVTRYVDQVQSLRNELVGICGLPEGCTADDIGEVEGCDVPTKSGRCGLTTATPINEAELRDQVESASVSEAGTALFELREAALAIETANETLNGQIQESRILGEAARAFAEKLADWDSRRRAVNNEIEQLLNEMTELDRAQMNATLETLRQEQQIRRQAFSRQRSNLDKWNQIRVDGNDRDLEKLGTITGLRSASSAIGLAAERVETFSGIVADSLPDQVGATMDPSASARLSTRSTAFAVSTTLKGTAEALQISSDGLSVDLANQRAMRDAKLSRLEGLADLNAARTENQIADLEQTFSEFEQVTEFEQASIDALIDALKRNLELDQEYQEDLQQLRDKRDKWRLALTEIVGLEHEVSQAELTARQRELAYFELVQRAQLLEGRYQNMKERSQDLSNLLGSPDVLFSSANRIALAESRLERARRKMNDWLTALEYYAVRPFVAQRQAILLARNPGQMEAIANELTRLQQVCGGPVTTETLDVSLRDDLLNRGYSTQSQDGTGAVLSAESRFQELMQRAESPVSRSVPYNGDQTLGERLDRPNVLAANFNVSIESFANLGVTCNAKLSSIAVKLVGEGLTPTAGSAQPVVSVVYGGQGQARSCQPGIEEYTAQFGPEATAFGQVTGFKTPGRTVSPVAGISEYGEERVWNATLEGLPFASDYTVLVDQELPSNDGINWDQLEDIELRFQYTYQDVFPEGQCE